MSRMAAPQSPETGSAKAALYLRVSTGRQAESNLSIPDQRRQLEAYCAGKGWAVAQEFAVLHRSGAPPVKRL